MPSHVSEKLPSDHDFRTFAVSALIVPFRFRHVGGLYGSANDPQAVPQMILKKSKDWHGG